MLSGVHVPVDQAAEDGFPADLPGAGAGYGGRGSSVSGAGDALGDALVRAGRVVVRLVLGQDGAQVLFSEDQDSVQDLAAQGAGEALAGRVHPGSLDGGAQDPGAVCLEDRIEGLGEIRSAVANQELEVLEPFAEAEREVAGLLHSPFASGVRGDAAKMHPPRAVFDEYQDVQPF